MENGEFGIRNWIFINGNVIGQKSFSFAVKIVRVYKCLCDTKMEYVLSKQLLRAGTSIGANVAEAQQAQSKADFISKMSIALKEAEETIYWIKLLNATGYLDDGDAEKLLTDSIELKKILVSILRTSRESG